MEIFKTIHSYWAYIVLAIVIFAVVNALKGMLTKKDFQETDLRISLFALIVSHLQLLIGLAWYFMSPVYKSMKASGMGEAMKNADVRLLSVEHPLTMIFAIILITIGFSRHKKKTTSKEKFNTIFLFYGIALILILVKIPWTNWFS